MRAIVLAAGMGRRLEPHTVDTPKCLLELGGKTLLHRYLEALAALGVPEAVLVVGHLKEQVVAAAVHGPAGVRVRVVENDRYTRGNIVSLWQARQEFDDDVLIMDADILFPREMLARLLAAPDANAIAVDEQAKAAGDTPEVACEDGWVVEVTKRTDQDPRVRGAAVGMLRLAAEAAEILREILEEFIDTGNDTVEYEEVLRDLASEVPIGVVEMGDLPWVGINVQSELARARDDILPRVELLDQGEAVAAR